MLIFIGWMSSIAPGAAAPLGASARHNDVMTTICEGFDGKLPRPRWRAPARGVD
jgi:hypothetical protein